MIPSGGQILFLLAYFLLAKGEDRCEAGRPLRTSPASMRARIREDVAHFICERSRGLAQPAPSPAEHLPPGFCLGSPTSDNLNWRWLVCSIGAEPTLCTIRWWSGPPFRTPSFHL